MSPTALHRLKDGQEALDFVQGNGSRTAVGACHHPLLLLLDIKMPRVDGVEVLRQLKSDPQTALVPVIMLTTTDDPREIQRCYELGCSVYITKPVDYQAFVEAINRLGLFLQVVRIPEATSEAVRTRASHGIASPGDDIARGGRPRRRPAGAAPLERAGFAVRSPRPPRKVSKGCRRSSS